MRTKKLGIGIAILGVLVLGIIMSNNSSHTANQIFSEQQCDPSYPDFCISPYSADLDCDQILYHNFRVLQPDRHGFDQDHDGIGCER